MRPVRCGDLAPGDILLRISDGAILGRAIERGLPLLSQVGPAVVDAGVLLHGTALVEARRGGLTIHDLRVENEAFAYLTFRARKTNLATSVGRVASLLLDRGRGAAIDEATPMLSTAEADRLLAGFGDTGGSAFAGPRLVIDLFRLVAEWNGIPGAHLFPHADGRVVPPSLVPALAGNGEFTTVGYLVPHER